MNWHRTLTVIALVGGGVACMAFGQVAIGASLFGAAMGQSVPIGGGQRPIPRVNLQTPPTGTKAIKKD